MKSIKIKIICPDCGSEDTRFLDEKETSIICWECGKTISLFPFIKIIKYMKKQKIEYLEIDDFDAFETEIFMRGKAEVRE